MKPIISLQRYLIYGVIVGMLIAALNGLVAPVLMEVESFIVDSIRGGPWFGLATSWLGLEGLILWIALAIDATLRFLIPSIIGISGLGYVLYRSLPHRAHHKIWGVFVGGFIGFVIAGIDIMLMIGQGIQPGDRLAIGIYAMFILIVEIILFVLAGLLLVWLYSRKCVPPKQQGLRVENI